MLEFEIKNDPHFKYQNVIPGRLGFNLQIMSCYIDGSQRKLQQSCHYHLWAAHFINSQTYLCICLHLTNITHMATPFMEWEYRLAEGRSLLVVQWAARSVINQDSLLRTCAKCPSIVLIKHSRKFDRSVISVSQASKKHKNDIKYGWY